MSATSKPALSKRGAACFLHSRRFKCSLIARHIHIQHESPSDQRQQTALVVDCPRASSHCSSDDSRRPHLSSQDYALFALSRQGARQRPFLLGSIQARHEACFGDVSSEEVGGFEGICFVTAQIFSIAAIRLLLDSAGAVEFERAAGGCLGRMCLQ